MRAISRHLREQPVKRGIRKQDAAMLRANETDRFHMLVERDQRIIKTTNIPSIKINIPQPILGTNIALMA